jgi:hypothetical protein
MMSKNAKSKSDTWSHHDTMISNLRDWVNREINLLRTDISNGAPSLSSSTSKILKNAEDLNVQMFDLIRSVAEMAEKESKKKVSTD